MSMPTDSIAAEKTQIQRRIGPTPFASVREPLPDTDVHLLGRTDMAAQRQARSVKVHFNMPRAHGSSVASALWSLPPPTHPVQRGDTLPSVGSNGAPLLPKDTLHPLISSLQAAENAKAASFNPAVEYNSNASRTAGPCEAHVNLARRGHRDTYQRAEADAIGSEDGDPENPDLVNQYAQDDDDDVMAFSAQRGPRGGGRAAAHSRRGDLGTAAGRAYNAEGAFHEPEQYTSHIVDFAMTQPTTITAIAAKALGRALHDAPPLAIGAHAFAAPCTLPEPNSAAHGRSANRHLLDGLNALPHGALPPSSAFRALPGRLKSILLNRPSDARLVLETAIADLRRSEGTLRPDPVTPPLYGALPPVSEQEVPTHVAQDVPAGGVDDLVMRGGSLDIWQDAIRRFAPRNAATQTPLPTSHPMIHTGIAGRQLKSPLHTPSTLYGAQSTRPAVRLYIGGCGLRAEDELTQVKLPSQAGFLSDPSRARNVKQYTNIPYTPINAFGFDTDRLRLLLSETGLQVEHLDLEGSSHIDCLSDIARFCPNLRQLHLGGCTQLTLDVLSAITRSCTLLTCLNLSRVGLTSEAVAVMLKGCRDLMVLVLSGNPAIDSAADPAFMHLSRHRQLRVLDVSYCPHLTDVALHAVSQYCPALEVLDITGCLAISDAGVSSIGSSCPLLKVWRLGLCEGLSAEGLGSLCSATRHLEVLDLSGCTQLTVAAVKEFSQRLTRLIMLSLAGCWLITDEAVQAIARQCRQLQMVNLSSCTNISLHGCMELIHELAGLSALVVSESSISNAEVVMLSSLRETCKITRTQYRSEKPQPLIGYRAPEAPKKNPAAGAGKAPAKKK